MVGVPGAGKSQFAAEFAKMFHAPRLDIGLLESVSQDEPALYAMSLELLREVMKTRQTIVFEGATDKRTRRMELAKLARQAGYKILFVWVQTDIATAQLRWTKTTGGSEADYEAKVRQFSAPHPSEPCVVISGRHTYTTQARTLLRRLVAIGGLSDRITQAQSGAEQSQPAQPRRIVPRRG